LDQAALAAASVMTVGRAKEQTLADATSWRKYYFTTSNRDD